MIPFWLSNLFASLELVLVLWMVPSGDITLGPLPICQVNSKIYSKVVCSPPEACEVAPSKEYCWNRWLEERMLFWCFGNPFVELKYEVCGHVWHSSISPVPYFCHGFVDSASHDPHYFQLRFEFDCPAHRNLQITSDALDFWYPVSSFTHLFCRVFRTILTVFVVELLMGTSFVLVLGKGWVNQSICTGRLRDWGRSSNQLGCALSGCLDSLVARWGRQGLDVKDLFRGQVSGRLPTDSNGMRDMFVGCKL